MKKLIIYSGILMGMMAPVFGSESQPSARISVDVNGLVCDFCARSLEKFLGKQVMVADVQIDLASKVITIEVMDDQTVDDETLTQWVTDAGYAVRAIRRGE